MTNKGSIYTRQVIAQLLNLSEKRIKQLTQDAVIEEYSSGLYKLVPTVQRYIKYLQAQISDSDKASDYNIEKAQLTRAKREVAELELQVMKNGLHKAEDIEFIMTNQIIACKSKLSTLPYKVIPIILNTPDTDDRTEIILKALKDAVNEALNELSKYNADFFDKEKYLQSLDDTLSE